MPLSMTTKTAIVGKALLSVAVTKYVKQGKDAKKA